MAVEIGRELAGADAPKRKVWRDAADLLSRIVEHCDELRLNGADKWWLYPVKRVSISSQSRFRCRHFDGTKLIVAVRPAANDSTWEYHLQPPRGLATMVAGRVLTLWNGWSGRGVPDAYTASLHVDDEASDEASDEAAPSAVSESEVAKPIAKPAVIVAPQPAPSGVGDLAQMMSAIQSRLAQVSALRADMLGLERRRNECAAQAEALLNEAEDVDREIAKRRAALEAPELRQALAAAEAFRAMVGEQSKGGA